MQLRAVFTRDNTATSEDRVSWRMIVLRKGPTPVINWLDAADEAFPLPPVDDQMFAALDTFMGRRGASYAAKQVGPDVFEVVAEGRSTIALATWLEGLARQAAFRNGATPTSRIAR